MKIRKPFNRKLSIKEKLKVIDMFTNGNMTRVDIAKELGLAKSTVGRIINKQHDWKNWESLKNKHKLVYADRPCRYADINAGVTDWFIRTREKEIAVSGKQIQRKALEIAKELNEQHFRASNGWLESWKKANNVSLKCVSRDFLLCYLGNRRGRQLTRNA